MRVLIAITLAATMAAAQPHAHNHQQMHREVRKRNPSPVEKREPDVVTKWVASATETVYVLNDEEIPSDRATTGIEDGELAVVGESIDEIDTSVGMGAQFLERPEPIPEPEPEPEGDGLTSKFPSGKVKCSEFPSRWGPKPVDYLGTGGWTGIQRTPSYSKGDASISYIETAIRGESCTRGAFCSYACPPGWQKTQWPEAQGSTLQSIGGLYCNSEGNLELTREGKDTLCEKGAGGVFIQNDLDELVATCQTDYPGTESMVIATPAGAGELVELTNPYSPDYYFWNGEPTTAQYYVNKKGVPVNKACLWDSPEDHDGRGNWAPNNIGVGKSKDGNTYISIFNNSPTSTAKLDFNIEITGDVNGKCSLINGRYSGSNSNGCTTAVRDGGKAIIRYFK